MNRTTTVAFGAALSLVVAVAAQSPTAPPARPSAPSARPAAQTAAPTPAAPAARSQANSAASSTISADQERQLLNTYCSACHNEKAKATMDSSRKLAFDALDVNDLHKDGATWELVIRKMRAGMMPPANMKRPDPAVYESMITYLENTLDRQATPFMPPPGLHRLNRTEYVNVVRDLLDISIDPSKYLPNDDATRGFDNIAGTLGLSSTLVEAYVTAAQHISRLAVGEVEPPSLVVYRTPEDTSQDYHVEGLPFGTRGGLVVDHPFPSDGEYTMTITPIFGDNMSPTGFGSVPCEKLAVLLDGERVQLLDWQGGRGGGGGGNCGGGNAAGANTNGGAGRGGGRGGGRGAAAGAPAAAAPATAAAAPAAGAQTAAGAAAAGQTQAA
ncbi:MAG TPA: DUF1587 domain-containing protein, partial [Vicinamibacterales bacterium]|nr:DUF1587 domain-containing protein [Vicinamibacterales bacterium]